MSPLFLLVLTVTLFGFSTAIETELPPVGNRHLQPSPSSSNWQAQLLKLVNDQRGAHGVKPLCMNTKLQAAAQAHSTDMAIHNFINHKGWNGSFPHDRVKAAGYSATASGENVATGQQSIREVMDSWLQSSKHRANIMSSSFTMFGCGYDKKSQSFWTQVFASSNVDQCLQETGASRGKK